MLTTLASAALTASAGAAVGLSASAIGWIIWSVVRRNAQITRRHGDAIDRLVHAVISHERSIAKIEGREPHVLRIVKRDDEDDD